MRETKFTMKEFKAIPRYESGDMPYHILSENFMWFTDEQIDKLSDDDWSRVNDLEMETSWMAQEFLREMD